MTSSNHTTNGLTETLNLFSAEIQRNPYGDDAKHAARMIVRKYGKWIHPYLSEIIAESIAAADVLKRVEAIMYDDNSDLIEYGFDLYDMHTSLICYTIDGAADDYHNRNRPVAAFRAFDY